MDYDLWYIVMNGPIIPKKREGDTWVTKTQEDLDEKDKIMISKNANAKNYLICGLERSIYNSVEKA